MTARMLALLAALLAAGASAQMREIEDGRFAAPAPTRAYILYHEPAPKLPAQPIFMALPSDRGQQGAERLYAARNGRFFAKGPAGRVYLLEVPPGDYLVYGLSMSMAGPTLATCFCLGTVAFTARADRITDLGAVVVGNARSPSSEPELAAETGLGLSIDTGIYQPVAAIRATRTPVTLPGAMVEPVVFRPSGRFFDPRTAYVNRLAPIPGVLAYAGGRPIDRNGMPLPDHLAD